MLTMECCKTKNCAAITKICACLTGFLKAALVTSCLWAMLILMGGWAILWRLLQLWGLCLHDSDYTNVLATTKRWPVHLCDTHSEVEFIVMAAFVVIGSAGFIGLFIFLGVQYSTRDLSIRQKSTTTKCFDPLSQAKTILSHKLVTDITDEGSDTVVKHLLEKTWRYDERLGRDAKALNHKRIHVKSILHVENEKVLKQYQKQSQATRSYEYPDELKQSPILTTKLTLETTDERKNVDSVKGSSDNLVPKSLNTNKEERSCFTTKVDMEPSGVSNQDDELDLLMKDCQKNLNPGEVYLFHGTKLENIPCILETGFDLKRSRTGLYGRAIYLAESSEKADQYADYSSNRRETDLAMLVVRVALGRMHCHMEEGRVKVPHSGFVAGGKPKYDTVVAGHNKRFREFLVYNQKRIYPEYVVLYDRIQ